MRKMRHLAVFTNGNVLVDGVSRITFIFHMCWTRQAEMTLRILWYILCPFAMLNRIQNSDLSDLFLKETCSRFVEPQRVI